MGHDSHVASLPSTPDSSIGRPSIWIPRKTSATADPIHLHSISFDITKAAIQYSIINSTMSTTSTSSRPKAQSATKRLLSELRDLETEPNPGFERIGVINDDDLYQWEAVMTGVEGTAYEGAFIGVHELETASSPASP